MGTKYVAACISSSNTKSSIDVCDVITVLWWSTICLSKLYVYVEPIYKFNVKVDLGIQKSKPWNIIPFSFNNMISMFIWIART